MEGISIEPADAVAPAVDLNPAANRVASAAMVGRYASRLARQATGLHRDMTSEEAEAFNQRKLGELHALLDDEDASAIKKDAKMCFSGARLSWKDVGFAVDVPDPNNKKQKITKTILEPSSGTVAPGNLVAMMGPSGCGKSTLLDIIAAKKTTVYTGTVYVNNKPRDELYPMLTAYVPQADTMFPFLTVKEVVYAQMDLCWRDVKGLPIEQKHSWADAILAELGLGHVLDTKIGGPAVRGISGGQRRRVTLAKGLVMGATFIFCDEPTSGLSSTDTEIAIRVLKVWAKRFNLSILVVIHQPKQDTAALFDDLILLTSQPGRVVYHGTMPAAFEHYAQVGYPVPAFVNPADFYLDMVSPGYKHMKSDEFAAYWKQHGQPKQLALVEAALAKGGKTPSEMRIEKDTLMQRMLGKVYVSESSPFESVRYRVPFPTQTKLLFKRELTLLLRDPTRLPTELVMNVLVGIVVGVAFQGVGKKPPKQQMGAFAMFLQMTFISTLVAIPTMDEPKLIVKLEAADNLYHIAIYVFIDFLIKMVVSTIGSTIFSFIGFALVELPWEHFGIFWVFAFLCKTSMEALLVCAPAIGKTAVIGQQQIMPVVMIAFLFNGFAISKATAPVFMRWALYVSPLFWCTQSLATEIYGGNSTAGSPGAELIDFYEYERGQTGTAIGVLLAFFAIFRTIQVLGYIYLHNPEK